MCSTVMYVLICVCLSYSALCLLECSFATILSHIFVCLCAYVSVCLFVIVMRIYVCLSSLCNIPTSCKDSINVLVCIMERSCLPVCLSVFVPVPVCIGLSACLFLFSYPSHLPLPHYIVPYNLLPAAYSSVLHVCSPGRGRRCSSPAVPRSGPDEHSPHRWAAPRCSASCRPTPRRCRCGSCSQCGCT